MSRHRGDEGFTLVETMVALSIVGTVMVSLAMFFVRSATIQHRQADTQVATQLAASAMDFVSQLPAENVLLGRTQQNVQNEWQAPGVSTYLDPARTEPAWQDPSLPATPTLAGLPTTPESIQLTGDSTTYQRWWYVGSCWQPTAGGDCVVVSTTVRSQYVQMYRVVVAITWPSPECAGNQCQHITTMLTEATLADPTWQ